METVPRGALITVAILAALVKAVGLFVILPMVIANKPVSAAMFPDGYDLIAWNLAIGNGYRMFEDTSLTMVRTPGFVLVLAGLFTVFGNTLLPVQAANYLLSVLAAVLTFSLARRVFRSDITGIIAGLIVLLHPGTFVADSRGGPESMLMLFIALTAWMFQQVLRDPHPRHFLFLGLAFGVMMLIKSSVALILPGMAGWVIYRHWQSGKRRAVISGAALACLVTALCMAPWIIRNFIISGAFVPTMTVGGLAAFQGQYVIRNLSSGKEHAALLDEAANQQLRIASDMGLTAKGYFFQQFHSVADELAFYSELGRRTWKDYLDSPMLIAKAVAYNSVAFWIQGKTASATALNAVIAVPLLLLVAAGAGSAWRQGHEIAPLLLFATCFILPHLVIMSMARYYIPLLPVLSIVAAFPLASATRRFKASKDATR